MKNTCLHRLTMLNFPLQTQTCGLETLFMQITIDFLLENIIQMVTQGQMTHSSNILLVHIGLGNALTPQTLTHMQLASEPK